MNPIEQAKETQRLTRMINKILNRKATPEKQSKSVAKAKNLGELLGIETNGTLGAMEDDSR